MDFNCGCIVNQFNVSLLSKQHSLQITDAPPRVAKTPLKRPQQSCACGETQNCSSHNRPLAPLHTDAGRTSTDSRCHRIYSQTKRTVRMFGQPLFKGHTKEWYCNNIIIFWGRPPYRWCDVSLACHERRGWTFLHLVRLR